MWLFHRSLAIYRLRIEKQNTNSYMEAKNGLGETKKLATHDG